MLTDDEKLAEALEQVRGALAAMRSGNPEPYIDCWAESEDVTLFGAYTVGFERGEVTVDDGPARTMTIRVTHIYRRFGGAWRLVHRHADFPPPDQRRPGS